MIDVLDFLGVPHLLPIGEAVQVPAPPVLDFGDVDFRAVRNFVIDFAAASGGTYPMSVTIVAESARRLRATLKNNGAVMGLAGAAVSLLVAPGYDPVLVVEHDAVVEDEDGGVVYYDAQPGDFMADNERYRARWKVDVGGPLPYLSEWIEVKVVS
jgi:hypothetical protein